MTKPASDGHLAGLLAKHGGFQGLSVHCMARLADSLGQELRAEAAEEGAQEDGFSLDFRTVPTGKAPWQIGLRGILGAQVIEGSLWVRAWLYLYFAAARMRPAGADVLVLRWNGEDDRWVLLGWEQEEHGESAAFDTF